MTITFTPAFNFRALESIVVKINPVTSQVYLVGCTDQLAGGVKHVYLSVDGGGLVDIGAGYSPHATFDRAGNFFLAYNTGSAIEVIKLDKNQAKTSVARLVSTPGSAEYSNPYLHTNLYADTNLYLTTTFWANKPSVISVLNCTKGNSFNLTAPFAVGGKPSPIYVNSDNNTAFVVSSANANAGAKAVFAWTVTGGGAGSPIEITPRYSDQMALAVRADGAAWAFNTCAGEGVNSLDLLTKAVAQNIYSFGDRIGSIAALYSPDSTRYVLVQRGNGLSLVVNGATQAVVNEGVTACSFDQWGDKIAIAYWIRGGANDGVHVVTGVGGGSVGVTPHPAGGDITFTETQFIITGKFADYYRALFDDFARSVAFIGLPLENEHGGVQNFERLRMEYHPENAGTPYEIQFGLANKELLLALGKLGMIKELLK